MSPSTTGLLTGLLFALVAGTAGGGWFLLALVLAVVGHGIGAHLEGRVDLASLVPGRRRG